MFALVEISFCAPCIHQCRVSCAALPIRMRVVVFDVDFSLTITAKYVQIFTHFMNKEKCELSFREFRPRTDGETMYYSPFELVFLEDHE